MSPNNKRFTLNAKRYVIDNYNSANSGRGYCHEGDPEDDRHLRERVLWVLFATLVDKLIINQRPLQKDPTGEEYQPFNEEARSIASAAMRAIRASVLYSADPIISIEKRFDGKLKREKQGLQDYTSLALFRDDVECLLRDLYGDIEDKAVDDILWAVFWIVETFTRYVRDDLWNEYHDAVTMDRYLSAIGLDEGEGINSSQWRQGCQAADDLRRRMRAVRANPTGHSAYTLGFLEMLERDWPYLNAEVEAAIPSSK